MEAKEMMTELAERIGKAANVRAVFGEPIREEKQVIIPVARVIVRGGGGKGGVEPRPGELEGDHKKNKGTGIGMGVNVVAAPVGYIKMGDDGPAFVPIIDKTRMMFGAMGVMAMALWVAKSGLKLAKR